MKPLLHLMLKSTKVINMKVVEETFTEAGGVEYTVQYEGIEFKFNGYKALPLMEKENIYVLFLYENEVITVSSESAVKQFETMINNLIM